MSRTDVLIVIFCMIAVICMLLLAAGRWKMGRDRQYAILRIRNCQQAMRSHQGVYNLNTGAPFTKRDLERYLPFPTDMTTIHGTIRFHPGDKITPSHLAHPESGINLWLKMTAPNTHNYVGQYGFEDDSKFEDW